MTHFGRTPHVVWPEQTLGEVLKQFRQGTSHMAIVRDVNSTGAVSDSVPRSTVLQYCTMHRNDDCHVPIVHL